MRALTRLSLAMAIAALALSAPAADATVLTWIESENVWIANPDGSGKRQLTTAGTGDSPYRSPTSDDSGVVVAARGQEYFRLDQTGKVLNANLAPMGPCNFGKPFPAPIRVDATGEWVSYGYICNSGYPSFSNNFEVAISPAANAYATGNQIEWDAWFQPTWYGKRLVVSDSQKIFIQPAASDPPAPAAPSFGYAWIAAPGISLARAVVNRAGNAVLMQGHTDDGNGGITDHLIWGRLPAGVPDSTDGTPAEVADSCAVPVQGTPIFSDFSPDGTLITWSDAGGVKVSPTPTYNGTDQCTASPAVIAAAGSQPAFGASTLTTASGPAPGGPAPSDPGTPTAVCSGCANPTVAQKPSILIAKGSLKALRAKGLVVPVRCPVTCSIEVTLLDGKKAIARGRSALKGAGTAKVRIRATKAGKMRLRKARRLRGALRAVVKDPSGRTTTATRVLKLR
jgi:hypothetical protein